MFEYYTIAIIAILAAISPGPDFVVVAKNAMLHERSRAMLTSLGIGAGILIHSTYCVLGLALIISQSILLFSIIKYLGAAYLIYLGIKSLLSKQNKTAMFAAQQANAKQLSTWQAFRDGLLTNVLNPKCTLFMLSIFTVVVKPHTALLIQATYGIEIAAITTGWFLLLTLGLTHRTVKTKIVAVQNTVSKLIGIVLIALGITVIFEAR